MYVVILVVLGTVSARDISQAGYFNDQPLHGRFDGQFVNTPLQTNQRNDNDNYHRQNGQVNLNHEQFRANNGELETNQRNGNAKFHSQNRQVNFNREQNANDNRQFEMNQRNGNDNYHNQNGYVNLNNEQFNANNDGQLIANVRRDSNDRDRNVAYVNQGRSHDNTESMNVNIADDRQENQNRHKHDNFNMHRQSFENNENRNRNNSNQDRSKYIDTILQARRQQDEMVFEDSNRRTQEETDQKNNSLVNQNNGDIISFIGKVNTNQNDRRNQSNVNSTDTKEAPKTTIDNEVTLNPSQNGEAEKENRTLDKDDWVWGVVETTTMGPNVTLDDRAAFTGDKCATGMVRVMGKCVEED